MDVHSRTRALRRIAVAIMVLAVLPGCASPGRTTAELAPQSPQALVPSAWLRRHRPLAGRRRWWRALQIPALDQLIDAALSDSPTVAMARTRVAGGPAGKRGGRRPAVAGARCQRRGGEQRFSRNYFTPPQYAGRNLEVARASLDANLDLDFWGRDRASLAAALGQEAATRAEFAQAEVRALQRDRPNLALARWPTAAGCPARGPCSRNRAARAAIARASAGPGCSTMRRRSNAARLSEQEARRADRARSRSSVRLQLAITPTRRSALVGEPPGRRRSGRNSMLRPWKPHARRRRGRSQPSCRCSSWAEQAEAMAAHLARIDAARASVDIARAELRSQREPRRLRRSAGDRPGPSCCSSRSLIGSFWPRGQAGRDPQRRPPARGARRAGGRTGSRRSPATTSRSRRRCARSADQLTLLERLEAQARTRASPARQPAATGVDRGAPARAGPWTDRAQLAHGARRASRRRTRSGGPGRRPRQQPRAADPCASAAATSAPSAIRN
jgi:hypothetical protein